jgi:chemotaxis protein methyltransferase CheR
MSRRDEDAGFAAVLQQIDRTVDFETSHYDDSYLGRRIAARMRRRDTDSHDDYAALLQSETDEREALRDTLTINTTSFFRNPEMWEALRPILRDVTDDGSARVWSAPCADGREAYSISMLAHDDPELRPRRLSVVGTDIDERALDAARAGSYETTRTTDIGDELSVLDDPDTVVERHEETFTVRDSVRRPVEFETHDLVRDGPRSGFDVVLCRNLLIYIRETHQTDVFDVLAESLRSGGYLVIGMTETLPREYRDVFEVVDRRHRIYRRRDG